MKLSHLAYIIHILVCITSVWASIRGYKAISGPSAMFTFVTLLNYCVNVWYESDTTFLKAILGRT